MVSWLKKIPFLGLNPPKTLERWLKQSRSGKLGQEQKYSGYQSHSWELGSFGLGQGTGEKQLQAPAQCLGQLERDLSPFLAPSAPKDRRALQGSPRCQPWGLAHSHPTDTAPALLPHCPSPAWAAHRTHEMPVKDAAQVRNCPANTAEDSLVPPQQQHLALPPCQQPPRMTPTTAKQTFLPKKAMWL